MLVGLPLGLVANGGQEAVGLAAAAAAAEDGHAGGLPHLVGFQ
jgi:hypothetical protein